MPHTLCAEPRKLVTIPQRCCQPGLPLVDWDSNLSETHPVPAVVEIQGVIKEYPLGDLVVRALHGIDLQIEAGEFTTVAGPSGSGKSTLLNLIGCVDVPTSGTVTVEGQPTTNMGDRELTHLRLNKLGFIFQSFNLVNVLSAYQNVELPLLLQGGMSPKARDERVRAMIDRVQLTKQIDHRPNELSGGQRQRVAIARALITRPKIVLADEPTANLDSATGIAILDLMKELNEAQKTTFIFSTHDPKVMDRAGRIIHLADGRLQNGGS